MCRISAALSMSWAIGCAHVPSGYLVRDRFDYGQSVAESWKRQMLLNVVRMRYGDAPIFMDVTTVINSYTLAGNASATPTIYVGKNADPNELAFGASAVFSNTPTVTYQPLTGDRFMKSMLQPVPPVGVFQMLQSGWPAELSLRIAVQSINGLTNQVGMRAADPRFDQLVAAVSRLQAAGGVNIRVQTTKDGEGVIVALPVRPDLATGTFAADRAEVQRLLGLDPQATEYPLVFGMSPRSPSEIAVLTRSMLEIIVEYGFGIDVPETDLRNGRASTGTGIRIGAVGTPISGGEPSTRLTHVRSGTSPPRDAYAAVPYRDRWYWIEDEDLVSKLRFTFLMILSSLAETGVAPATPVITIPSR